MQILPIGTIVKLKNGERKLMIINRTPLFDDKGTVGYFDYCACLYPEGQADQEMYFFNEDDIDEICFIGYVDENEEEFRKIYAEKIDNIGYPKLMV